MVILGCAYSLVWIGETEKINLLLVHSACGGMHATVPTTFDLILLNQMYLGQSHACLHMHHVLEAGLSSRSHQLRPNCMHTLGWPWQACMASIVHFRHSMHFLGFFRRKNPTTLPPSDATCVLCPNSCTPCLGDHIGHAHMVPKVGVISCMPPHAPCTSRTIRVCRRAGLKVVYLPGPTN